MNKKLNIFLSMFIAFSVLFCQVIPAVSADPVYYTPTDKLTYEVYGNAVAVTGCDLDVNNLSIPPVIDGCPVVLIAQNAFYAHTNIVIANIPSTVTAIGSNAFANCTLLSDLTLTDNITSIGEGTFENCTSLSTISLPAQLTSVQSATFAGCTGLTSVTVPNSVTSIESGAFAGCTSLESMTLPFIGSERGNSDTFESVFGYIFGQTEYNGSIGVDYYMQGIYRTYYIPQSLRTVTITDESVIGAYAFSGCLMLTAITYPVTVTTIGKRAFENCSGVSQLVIPTGITAIEEYTFAGCSGITSFTVPDNVLSIGYGAFYGCTSLTGVTLPFIGYERGNKGESAALFGYVFGSYNSGATQPVIQHHNGSNSSGCYLPNSLRSVTITDESVIAPGAFENCTMLTSITYPDTVTEIGDWAFRNCSGVSTLAIPSHISVISEYTFENCTGLPSTLNIPNTVQQIKTYAFKGCTNFQVINIPKNVTKIEYAAFYGCTSITTVTLPFIGSERGNKGAGEALFGYIFGSYNSGATQEVIQHHNGSNSSGCYLPNSLRNVTITDESIIAPGAFENCSMLTSITYPDTITEIGGWAFRNCTGVSTLAIPSHVSVIDEYTFEGCTGLPSTLNIPSTITEIKTNAFKNCTNLEVINIPKSVTKMGYAVFYGCTSITDVTLPFIGSERGNKGESAALFGYIFGSYNSSATQEVIQNHNGSNSSGCYLPNSLRSVTITDESIIAPGAFENCSMLTSITYPDTVTEIGGWAFRNCSGVSTLAIPSHISVIDEKTFEGCTGLPAELVIPDNITEIKAYAFNKCTNLTDVTVPESVESIGYAAFKDCTSIENVTLPFIGSQRGNKGSSEALFPYIFASTNTSQTQYVAQHHLSGNQTYFYVPISLKNVTITDESIIASGAFENCSMLESIEYPDTVTELGQYAFRNCTEVSELPIPSGISVIESYTFDNCTGLSSTLVIPDNIKEIKSYAYINCSNLTDIIVPESVEKIEYAAFVDCVNIESITLPFVGSRRGNSGTSEAMFGYIFGTSNRSENQAVIQHHSGGNASGFYIPISLKDVTITDETRLAYGSFENCSMIEDLTYNDTVLYVDNNVFTNSAENIEVVIPLSYTDALDNATDIDNALTAGEVKVNITFFDKITETVDLYIGMFDSNGCLVGVKTFKADPSVPFSQTITLPQGKDIAEIKTMSVNSEMMPLMKIYTLN